jgi:hypothetical protein
MSTVAEPLASSTHDEKHFEGARLVQPKPALEHSVETDHAFAETPAATPPPPSDLIDDLPIHQVIRLLRSPAPGHAANSGTRSSAAQRIQRLYGNRASQQIVMRAPAVQRQCACGGTCAKCQEKEQQRQVQRQAQAPVESSIQRSSAAHAPAEFDGIPASTGEQLDPAIRLPMEAHFGADLTDVRVHTGAEAAKSATSLDALAYTSGRDIYFAPGMYAPRNGSGQRLLAHEVAHVVQQSAGREPSIAAKLSHGIKIGAEDDALETEAEQAAQEFVSGGPPHEEGEAKKRKESPASVQRFVQRQPVSAPPPEAAPAPVAAPTPATGSAVTPPAAAPAPWSLRGFLAGTQKVNVKAGSHKIYNEYAGKNFGWSTDEGKAAGEKISIPLGLIPVPPPVGPIAIEIAGGASVYVGGHALIDVALNDVVLELTASDIAKLEGVTLLALTGGGLLPALARLQGVNIYGKATLAAKAQAKVNAGAKLNLELAANSVWPAKGFVEAGLGISGEIGALANFSMIDAPIVLDFLGPIPRFRVLNLNITKGAELTAGLRLDGYLGIGVELGYGRASVRRTLLSASYQPMLSAKVGQAIRGGKEATLTTSGNGTPEIDLQKISLMLNDLSNLVGDLGKLLKGAPRNDDATPLGEAPGKAPTGTHADPVLIYWCKPPRIYQNVLRLDDADGHELTPYYRDKPQLLDREENMTIGVTYWPEVGDRITKRDAGKARAEQHRFTKVLERHNYDRAKSDFWQFSPDHVLDLGLTGNTADRIDNLWPAERTANEAAGSYHANQSVWLKTGDEEPKYPMALSNVPDGIVLKIRAIVQAPPAEVIGRQAPGRRVP